MVKYLMHVRPRRRRELHILRRDITVVAGVSYNIDEQDNCALHFGPHYHFFAMKPCIVMKFALPIV